MSLALNNWAQYFSIERSTLSDAITSVQSSHDRQYINHVDCVAKAVLNIVIEKSIDSDKTVGICRLVSLH